MRPFVIEMGPQNWRIISFFIRYVRSLTFRMFDFSRIINLVEEAPIKNHKEVHEYYKNRLFVENIKSYHCIIIHGMMMYKLLSCAMDKLRRTTILSMTPGHSRVGLICLTLSFFTLFFGVITYFSMWSLQLKCLWFGHDFCV